MFYPSTASESTSSYDHQQHFQERGARHARAARVREDDTWTTPGDVVFLVDSPVMFKEILRLQLIPASDFLSPGFVIQRVSGNSTWLEEIGELECFYSGYVEGEEDSVVSLAVCDGMVSGHDFVDLKQLPPPLLRLSYFALSVYPCSSLTLSSRRSISTFLTTSLSECFRLLRNRPDITFTLNGRSVLSIVQIVLCVCLDMSGPLQ